MIAANDNNPVNAGTTFRFLSVCSGIEAASCAWPEWQAVAFSEIEKFPSAVLAHHYPDVPNLGDFTKIDTAALGRVDIFCGGTPCQAFSVAGLRQSLADARGNLSLEFVRLAHELAARNGLRNVVWENVPGVLNTTDNAFGCFLAGLVGADAPVPPPAGRSWHNAGMVAGPKGRAAWRVYDAQFFGLAQRRKRVVVVADFGNGADPAAVLFERAGMSGNTPPSRETGQGVAAAVAECFSASSIGSYREAEVSGADRAAGGDNGGGSENLVSAQRWSSDVSPTLCKESYSPMKCMEGDEAKWAIVEPVFAPEIARCVATREGSSQDYESTTMVAVGVTGTISHALKAEGADASEDGTGRGTPIVLAFQSVDFGGDASVELSPTLRRHDPMAVCTVALRGREGGATAELGGEIATALRASSGGGDKPHVLTHSQDQGSNTKPSAISPTLTKEGPSGSAGGNGAEVLSLTSAVRRLTPRECERLQGFPDDYTAIPWRGKPADQCPDGPRYKALGNSWAVPLFTWLGRRIEMYMPHVLPKVAANDNNNNQTQVIRDAA